MSLADTLADASADINENYIDNPGDNCPNMEMVRQVLSIMDAMRFYLDAQQTDWEPLMTMADLRGIIYAPNQQTRCILWKAVNKRIRALHAANEDPGTLEALERYCYAHERLSFAPFPPKKEKMLGERNAKN